MLLSRMLSAAHKALFIIPLGEDALIEIHECRVVGTQLAIEITLHVAVRAQRLLDVTHSTTFGT